MTDDMLGQETVIPPVIGSEATPVSRLLRFWQSPKGKMIVVGAAVGVLLVIAGAVTAIVMLTVGRSSSGVTSTPAPGPARSATATVPAASGQTSRPTVVVPVTNKDVFTARNPFKPVIDPITSASSLASSSTEPSAPSQAELDTLTLYDVISSDGQLKALLTFGGVRYVAGVGERLGTTPWKVLSVGKSSVTMLYGDVRVTLSVGEGVHK